MDVRLNGLRLAHLQLGSLVRYPCIDYSIKINCHTSRVGLLTASLLSAPEHRRILGTSTRTPDDDARSRAPRKRTCQRRNLATAPAQLVLPVSNRPVRILSELAGRLPRAEHIIFAFPLSDSVIRISRDQCSLHESERPRAKS